MAGIVENPFFWEICASAGLVLVMKWVAKFMNKRYGIWILNCAVVHYLFFLYLDAPYVRVLAAFGLNIVLIRIFERRSLGVKALKG